MRNLLAIALGLAVLALIALVIPLVSTQRHLREVQRDLAKTNEQVVQDRAESHQLERTISNLKTELDTANKARTELKGNLEEATSRRRAVAQRY
jgi:septal ring factor EnvC (AmiA/AmiB activator)